MELVFMVNVEGEAAFSEREREQAVTQWSRNFSGRINSIFLDHL